MKIVDKIGIERELFLFDSNDILVEPAIYGFPYDEFGFLIEIRTQPCTHMSALFSDYQARHNALSSMAERLGLHIEVLHEVQMDSKFIKTLSRKYAYDSLLDTTANIYKDVTKSHATGLANGKGTAGLHIHFSRYVNGLRAQLPLFEIVKTCDEKFARTIMLSGRNLGEFEIKSHGFEYRSLPADVTLQIPIEFAFKLFKRYPYGRSEV